MNTDLLASVETCMRTAICASCPSENAIVHAALDHLAAGGSRTRAQLSLHASSQLRLDSLDSITLAAICELLHNASLIQDDLIDRAPLRRGAPSVWAAYGDSTAVCAGDLLLAAAFGLIGDLHSAHLIGSVLSLVNHRTREVILGQWTEESCSPDTFESYDLVAIAKSASLLSLPLELSLLLSGNAESLPMARRAAKAFATAYQMIDDLDDYDEDMRNGSLNILSVALRMGCATFEAARERVLFRIGQVLEVLHDFARALPLGCGTALLEYADAMNRKVSFPADSLMQKRASTYNVS